MPQSNLYLIHGSDDGAVSEAALKLFNQLKPEDADEFSNDIIDGNADNAEHAYQLSSNVIEALLTIPFFSGKKIVWLKSANFLGNDRTGESERAKVGAENMLETLKNGLGDDVTFIISTISIHKARRFFKYLKANATIKEFNKLDTSQDGWQEQVGLNVSQKAREFNLTFEPDALELFVNLCGVDTRQVNAELEKIDLFLGTERREVNLQDVRTIVPLTREGVIFEINNAIQKGDGSRALELIDQQLDQGESAIAIIRASLIPTIRNLFMAKAVSEMFPNQQLNSFNLGKVLGGIPQADTQWLPQKKAGGVNTWGLGKAITPSQAYPMSALRRAMEALLEADLTLVTSSLDHRMVLHRLVVELISSKVQRRRAS